MAHSEGIVFCTNCGTAVHPGSMVCPRCSATLDAPSHAHYSAPNAQTYGQPVMVHQGYGTPRTQPLPAYTPSAQQQSRPDPRLRETLITFLLNMLTSAELSEWLRGLDADARGTVDEKKARIRAQTKLFTAPTDEMIWRVVKELRKGQVGWAAEMCEKLGISIDGPKNTLIRRVHRYISAREGQVPWFTPNGQAPTIREVYPVVAWYPVYHSKQYEKDHYADFLETMIEVFGENVVQDQVAVAHGSSLKIDFHIGSAVPGHLAVGVEFKMPANNSDVQKALGQMGQYQSRYGESLVVVVFPDMLDNKHLVPFLHELTRMRIAHVVKKVWNE